MKRRFENWIKEWKWLGFGWRDIWDKKGWQHSPTGSLTMTLSFWEMPLKTLLQFFCMKMVNFWGSGKSKNKRFFRLPVKFPKSPICVASCYLGRGRDRETRIWSEKEASRTQHLHYLIKANWANWTVGPRNGNCYDKHLKWWGDPDVTWLPLLQTTCCLRPEQKSTHWL